MKILLGVDTSPHARETVSQVCRMAWPKGTSVHVLSVVAPSEPHYAPQPHWLAATGGNLSMIEAQEMGFHEELIASTTECLRRAGLEVESEIVHGDPRQLLVEAARAKGADLLVVGSHEHTGFNRHGAGHVANHVVAHAHCNVLVVRHDVASAAG
jgi:nucleotide-binding universal stress UspA family protein